MRQNIGNYSCGLLSETKNVHSWFVCTALAVLHTPFNPWLHLADCSTDNEQSNPYTTHL